MEECCWRYVCVSGGSPPALSEATQVTVTRFIADRGQQGNYLVSTKPQSQPASRQLTYFPSSELPLEPLARFSDLFLTRSRWRAEEIGPFLDGIAIDRKERDRLLLKYARTVTTPDGAYYTARTTK